MSELYMDMTKGTKQDRILAAINQMKEVQMRMHSQPTKHDTVQVLHLNDCVTRIAQAMEVLLQSERERL